MIFNFLTPDLIFDLFPYSIPCSVLLLNEHLIFHRSVICQPNKINTAG